MLTQITWATYLVSVFLISALYYFYVLGIYYRSEISGIFSVRQSGEKLHDPQAINSNGQHDIIGKVSTNNFPQEDYLFGPPDPDEWEPYIEESDFPDPPTEHIDSKLVGLFSEMIAEVRTLIRVVAESSEPQDNFQMLFTLIAQKFSALRDTPYQHQINEFLLNESQSHFPFEVEEAQLNQYWTEE